MLLRGYSRPPSISILHTHLISSLSFKMLSIVAMLSSASIFMRPREAAKQVTLHSAYSTHKHTHTHTHAHAQIYRHEDVLALSILLYRQFVTSCTSSSYSDTTYVHPTGRRKEVAIRAHRWGSSLFTECLPCL